MCIKCKSFKEITAGFSPTRIEENPGNEVDRCSTSVVLFDNAVGTFFRSAPLRSGDWVNLFDRRSFVRNCSFLDNGSLINLFNYSLLQ